MKKIWKTQEFLVKPGSQHPLRKFPTFIADPSQGEADLSHKLDELRQQLSKDQEIFYADARYGLIIILQGMDAAGKDSAIEHIMSGVNPMGVDVTSFRPPSEDENRHDFLRRAHEVVPKRGHMQIFNRSYYEEVVTVRVNPDFLLPKNLPPGRADPKNIFETRYQDIVNFESYLNHQGYVILKFFLHLSKQEQKKRLLARLDEKDKNWKFDPSDVKTREAWKKHQHAYEKAIAATSTKENPWYVIPADEKKQARVLISEILLDKISQLPLRYPLVSAQKQKQLRAARRELLKDSI
jgi:PPK2 family polyphosphate:nucleotide phosphotransferase